MYAQQMKMRCFVQNFGCSLLFKLLGRLKNRIVGNHFLLRDHEVGQLSLSNWQLASYHWSLLNFRQKLVDPKFTYRPTHWPTHKFSVQPILS
jgi:hypothetical protein